jgi:hypothetical protein
MTLDSFIKNVMNLDAKDLILKAAALNKKELADLNRANLSKGKLSSGDDTMEYKTIAYTNKKASMGSISVPKMDFKLTGDFHKGISVEVGNEIVFNGADGKTSMLLNMYGDDLLGVQTDDLVRTTDSDIVKIMDKEMTK